MVDQIPMATKGSDLVLRTEEEEEEEEEDSRRARRGEGEGDEEEVDDDGDEEVGGADMASDMEEEKDNVVRRTGAVGSEEERKHLLPSKESPSSSFSPPSPSLASASALLTAVEEALDQIGFGTFQLMLLTYAGMAWLADAAEMILLSYLGPGARCEWGLSPAEESFISSAVFVGMLLGCYCWGVVSDIKGRRWGFMATALLTLVASLLSAASPCYLWLVLTRGLTGFGIGGGAVVYSLFLEFAPVRGRGFWMVCIGYFWSVGTVLEALLAWAVMPSLGWRILTVLSTPPFLLLFAFYPFLPESPRYLVVKGRGEEAEHVVQRVADVNKRNKKIDLFQIASSLSNLPPLPPPPSGVTALPSEPSCPSSFSTTVIIPHTHHRGGNHVHDDHGDDHLQQGDDPSCYLRSSSSTPDASASVPSNAIESRKRMAMASTTAATTKKKKKKKKKLKEEVMMRPPPGYDGDEGNESTWTAALCALRRLFSKDLRRSTSLLWFVSFASAFTYYGLVLLATEFSAARCPTRFNLGSSGSIPSSNDNIISSSSGSRLGPESGQQPSIAWRRFLVGVAMPSVEKSRGRMEAAAAPPEGAGGDSSCTPDHMPVLQVSDYVSVLVASVAEFPGLLLAAAMVDWLGRKATMSYLLAACAIFTAPLLSLRSVVWVPVLLFGARGSITGAFSVLWAYAPELYPTAVRSTGIGLTSAVGRVGGFLCPFVAVGLIRDCYTHFAVCLMVLVPALASIACTFFPLETMGMRLDGGDCRERKNSMRLDGGDCRERKK